MKTDTKQNPFQPTVFRLTEVDTDREESEIQRLMRYLDKGLSQLNDAVEVLGMRIGPVMKDCRVSPVPEPNPEPTIDTSLGREIARHVEKVERIGFDVSVMIDRLAL